MPPFVPRIHFILEEFYSFVACAVGCLPIIPRVTSQSLTGPQLCFGQQRAGENTLATGRRHLLQLQPKRRKPDLLRVSEQAFPLLTECS